MSLELNGTNRIVYDNLNDNIVTLLKPKNWIINGGFDVWQRGTSFSNFGEIYTADRWVNLRDGSGATTSISRQSFTIGQVEVPNNPTYYLSYNVSVAGTGNTYRVLGQRIEDVTKLAGKSVSISFWAKADSTRTISGYIVQFFGSGGSSDVATSLDTFELTTTWQRFTKTVVLPSISGKTVGTNNFTSFRVYISSGVTLTFDIANVTLVEGSVPMEWQTEAYADVLRQCQRYYYRYSGACVVGVGFAYDTNNSLVFLKSQVPMRTIPSSVEYSNIVLSTGLADSSITSISLWSNDTNNSNISIISSGLTQYRNYYIRITNASGYIGFSAEL